MSERRDQTRGTDALSAERIREIAGMQVELSRRLAEQEHREARAEHVEPRSPEELVGEALLTAHRAAEVVLENARQEAAQIAAEAGRDATPVLAEAHRTLEEARALYREAQQTLERANVQVEALLADAREERRRLMDDSLRAVEERRAELDRENARLGEAINDLRTEWVSRAAEALARLDEIALVAGSTEDRLAIAGVHEEVDDRPADRSDAASDDVALDLHSRLSESGLPPPPAAGL